MLVVAAACAAALPAGAAELDLLNDSLDFSGATLRIRPYAELPEGFNEIIGMTYRPDDTRMYVTTTAGTVFTVDDGGSTVAPWWNAAAALQAATGRSMNGSGGQRGLQSVAFHPDFANAGAAGYGKLYTTMLEQRPGNSGSSAYHYLGNTTYGGGGGDGVLAEWTYDFGAGQVASNSYRELFRVNMPLNDHPIKQAKFNPYSQPGDDDYGLLYLTHGDSSGQDSTNDDPQDLGDVLGKMLRIDPLESGGDRYTIPAGNPFADGSIPGALGEVYAYGLRNPHTFSFNPDDLGGAHILVGDIGRDNIEEVNLVQAGQNYGWTKREGTFVHHQEIAPHPDTGYIDGVDPLPANEATVGVDPYGARYTYPVAQWDHNGADVEVGADWWTGNAISTAFVIDNGSDPELDNQFVHVNFASNHGHVYHNDFDDLLGAVTQLDPNDPSRDHPSELTQAENFRLRLALDDDNDPTTAALEYDDFNRMLDPNWARNDARFNRGPQGEMFISSKWNGLIYLATNTLPYDADFDGDQDVDSGDYDLWLANQGSTGYGSTGDANHDGLVDELDLAIWQDQFVLTGDYNADGRVDAADYTVWRDSEGQFGVGLAADGNGDGQVTSADYDLWVENFGETAPVLPTAAVPEPAGVLLLGVGAVGGWTRRS